MYRSSMSVHVEWSDRIGVVVIDRVEKRNAVDLSTLREIRAAQVEAKRRTSRVLVLRGAPPAFCSGADLDGVELGEFTEVLTEVLVDLGSHRSLTVAIVDGPALGAGMQLASSCDVRIASPNSTFGIPAAKLGLAVDSWTVARLTREIGWSTTRMMLLTGDAVTAHDMPQGFLTRITQADDSEGVLREAMALVEDWSLRAPLTIAAHKLALETISRGIAAPDDAAEADMARIEAWDSADATEGRRAFRERRPPDFQGR